MVTRLWDYNLPKIDRMKVDLKISTNFGGPQREMFEQKSGCNDTAIVSPDLMNFSIWNC